MQGIAVILGIVSFVASKDLVHHQEPQQNRAIDGSIKIYSATDNRRVGAINLRQSGLELEAFMVLGRLWGLPTGKYVGIVYQRNSRELNSTCDRAGPAIPIYRERYGSIEPMILFRVEIEDGYEPIFMIRADHVSLRPDAEYNLAHHFILVYRVSTFQMIFLKRFLEPTNNESAVACGVIVSGLIRPGNFEIPIDDRPTIGGDTSRPPNDNDSTSGH